MTFIFKGHVGCEEFLLTFKNEGKHVLSKRREPSPDDSGSHPRRPRVLNHNSVKTSKTHIPPFSDENLGLVNYPTIAR